MRVNRVDGLLARHVQFTGAHMFFEGVAAGAVAGAAAQRGVFPCYHPMAFPQKVPQEPGTRDPGRSAKVPSGFCQERDPDREKLPLRGMELALRGAFFTIGLPLAFFSSHD